jgi:hypothetical protein
MPRSYLFALAAGPDVSRRPAGYRTSTWLEPDGATQGWDAEIMRHARRDNPREYLDVITATVPGPSVLEVLGDAAHGARSRTDRGAVDAVRRAAASRGADLPSDDELNAAGLLPMRIRVIVDNALVDFVGLRGADLWCCGATVAEAAVSIVGVRWDAAVSQLVQIENPHPAGSHNASEVPDDLRRRRDWDEAVREQFVARSADGTGAIVVDQPVHLIVALHVRDAAQLAVYTSLPIPPLSPPVAYLANVDEAIRSEASTQWPSWWRGLAHAVDGAAALDAPRPEDQVDELGLDR